jgi:hypothetical protein
VTTAAHHFKLSADQRDPDAQYQDEFTWSTTKIFRLLWSHRSIILNLLRINDMVALKTNLETV